MKSSPVFRFTSADTIVRKAWLLAVITAVLGIASIYLFSVPSDAQERSNGPDLHKKESFDEVIQTARQNGKTRVIVRLAYDAKPVGTLTRSEAGKQRAEIKGEQEK